MLYKLVTDSRGVSTIRRCLIIQDRERCKLEFSPVAFHLDALVCVLTKVLMMRLEQETRFELEVSEITKPINSFDIHMESTITERLYETGCVKTNIGAFEVDIVFQPERCIMVEGRRVDIAMMKRLFEENKNEFKLKMLNFDIVSSSLIEGFLMSDVFRRQNYIQI